MKKMIFTAIASLISISAHALPYQVSNLALSCKDSSIRIPGTQMLVEVFSATQQNPNHQLRITRLDMNQGDIVLFEGPVQENFGEKSSALVSDTAELHVTANNKGQIAGKATVLVQTENGTETLNFPVTCQKFYQIMKSAELE